MPVILNLFQDILCLPAQVERAEKWVLKRVQQDDNARVER